MKKINLLLTAFVLFAFVIAGCGKKEETTTTTPQTTTNTTTPVPTKVDTVKKDTATTKENANGDEKTTDTKGKNIVKMETTMGTIKIKLFTKEAPITTQNFIDLINKKFYDGIIFHRVIDGFMIQGGDPKGTGTGGSDKTIQDEFGPGLKHSKAGMLSMANRGPNTGTSQFFITLAPTPHLDGKHAIFGEVIGGMDVVNKIGKTKTGQGDRPVEEIKMTKVTMVDK
ncbi:MAG: peptidylprolyl isomerase [Ignavibacteria bacterium]|nr:peptidylprolyl isomerase [Ignavibacteria bacterium]